MLSKDSSGELDRSPSNKPVLSVPRDDYVQVRNGQFWCKGARIKFWGAQSSPLGTNHLSIDREVKHFRQLGFNLYRSISVGSPFSMDYEPGDGSRMDLQDYTFAAIAKSGGFIWIDLLNNLAITSRDGDIIDDPLLPRDVWQKAMEGKIVRPSGVQLVWDRRTQEIYFHHIDRVLNQVNPYNGLRYADDPAIALYELVNEQWWTPTMLEGEAISALHPAMVKPLLVRWNKWVRSKYPSDATLRKTWGGLLPGESVSATNILLQPLPGHKAMDKMAEILGINIQLSKSRTDGLPPLHSKRGEDVIQFLVETHLEFKQKALARLRSHGRDGKGASVVPVLFDTGASFSVQSAYEHSFAPAFAFGSYFSQFELDRSKPGFPWKASLREPPDFGGWMNQNRIEGVPGVVYETMVFSPSKYRADFPFRMTAFGMIQDLDAINFHFYSEHANSPLKPVLPVPTTNHYWESVMFGQDEVMLASMKLASALFLHGGFHPPANPTRFLVGKDILYNPDSTRWQPYSKWFAPTVHQFGLRLVFNPSLEKSRFEGPQTNVFADVVNPVSGIEYRWKEGILAMQSQNAIAMAGFLPSELRLTDSVTLESLRVIAPEGTPYHNPGERYICFAICAQDDLPLDKSRDVVVMAVSTSWNSGFSFDVDKFASQQKQRDHPPLSAALAIEQGHAPILVSRVGWILSAPWLKGMDLECFNFKLESFRKERLNSGRIRVFPEEPLFYARLTR